MSHGLGAPRRSRPGHTAGLQVGGTSLHTWGEVRQRGQRQAGRPATEPGQEPGCVRPNQSPALGQAAGLLSHARHSPWARDTVLGSPGGATQRAPASPRHSDGATDLGVPVSSSPTPGRQPRARANTGGQRKSCLAPWASASGCLFTVLPGKARLSHPAVHLHLS